jgi:hypothetical protein
MKFIVTINNRKCVFTPELLEQFIDVLAGAEVHEEVYVGQGRGSTGSNNNYEHVIKPSAPDEWFEARVMSDDFVDTIKLRMKLDAAKND